jgi:UDP-N-acetylglucosamine--N-acetylmuramyl-(pentapeptide) pyrophosphoryl-undecaprenol N-acetylglucosamine transferase
VHIIITGGGTGGHIFPALEIAKEFKAQDPGIKITYVGNKNGLEEKLAQKFGFTFLGLRTHKIVGQTFVHKLYALYFLTLALLKSCWFLLKNKPDAVVGVGGYVSAPMLMASFMLGIKRFICEQNVVPGLANKILAKIAHKIFTSFKESRAFFPESKIILSGNPVRKEFFALAPKIFEHKVGLNILVSGGSMGASYINTHVPQAMALLRQHCPLLSITHQCGENKQAHVAQSYENSHTKAQVLSFIDNMPEAFKTHDLLISRAGATVAAEIMAAGMPAILIPYRFANGHQRENARALVQNHASLMLEEQENFSYELSQIIKNFYENKNKLEIISTHAQAMAKPRAAAIIVETVLKECQ